MRSSACSRPSQNVGYLFPTLVHCPICDVLQPLQINAIQHSIAGKTIFSNAEVRQPSDTAGDKRKRTAKPSLGHVKNEKQSTRLWLALLFPNGPRCRRT